MVLRSVFHFKSKKFTCSSSVRLLFQSVHFSSQLAYCIAIDNVALHLGIAANDLVYVAINRLIIPVNLKVVSNDLVNVMN